MGEFLPNSIGKDTYGEFKIMPVFLYKTTSSQQTKKVAGSLAKMIWRQRPKQKRAIILALTGDLGAGKTTFVQGFLRSLGVRKRITSPTFVIFKRFKNIYHIDCYRIQKPKDLLDVGLKEILENPQNIVLIEWAERIKRILPKNTIWLKFKHGKKINERIIKQ